MRITVQGTLAAALMALGACGGGERPSDPPERAALPAPSSAPAPPIPSSPVPTTAAAPIGGPAPPPSPASPAAAPAASDGPCLDAVAADARAEDALALCRARLEALGASAPEPPEEIAHSRAIILDALSRIAEARGLPEQASYFLHRSLRFEERAEGRAHLSDLALRPVTATLHREVFPETVFRPHGDMGTGYVLTANDAALPVRELAPDTTQRYEELVTDAANDLEIGVEHVDSPGVHDGYLRLRHGARWYHIDGGGGLTEAGTVIADRTLTRHESVDLLPGGSPEIVVEERSLRLYEVEACLFVAEQDRLLRVYGLETAGDGTEMGVRYAEILLEHTQRHEPAIRCAEPTTSHRPTFHWALDASFAPGTGTLTLTPVAGELPAAVTAPLDLRTLHCTWGLTLERWPCPR